MIRVDMSSPDLDKQIELLKYYPEFFKKHFRPALYRDVYKLRQLVEAGVPRRTGRAASALRSKVVGAGVNMEGHVGWYGNDMPWYINVVEHGAGKHTIEPKKPGGWLHFGSTFTRRVDHPGFSARKFMASAYSAIKPVIDTDLALANEAVLRELAVA